jgi:hypothetical protein
MLRYYVIGVYKTINNITVIVQSNYNLLRLFGGSPFHPEHVSPPAQMVLQLCGEYVVFLKKTLLVETGFYIKLCLSRINY